VILLPIPTTPEALRDSIQHWSPFLPAIAKRSKEPLADLIAKVTRRDVQPILVWDEVALRAVALLGIAYHRRGDDLIAEWIWMTGTSRQSWEHLLGDLEHYLKDHVGCAVIRPICRPGWKPFLKQHGYHETHVQMEKVL
jgi:hypothetical protein